MALIKCSECGKEISDKAAACVHCGCPISVSKAAGTGAVKKTTNEISPNGTATLTMDFNAVLFGAESERTKQSVYVKEMGCNVTFSVNNNIQEGQIIRVTIEDEKYSTIRFRVASVSRNQAPAATAESKTRIINYIECYVFFTNWVVDFFRSRRFLSIVMILASCIVVMAEYDMDLLWPSLATYGSVVALLFYGKAAYPLHHMKKYLKKRDGVEAALRSDMDVAFSVYKTLPGKRTLRYIRKMNPQAAQEIERQLAGRKKK